MVGSGSHRGSLIEHPACIIVKMSESGAQPDSTLRLLAISGIIGPILFTTVMYTLGFLQPGYSHITQPDSELGTVGAPYAIIMNINFIVSGLLGVAFAFGLHRGIGGGGSKVGPALLAVAAAGVVGTGIFPTNLAEPQSFTAVMHRLVSFPGSIAAMLAPIVISRRLKRDSLWQGYRSYSLVTGVVAIGTFLLLLVGFRLGFITPWVGAVQRLLLGVLLLWGEVMAIRLLRVSTAPS